MLNSFLSLGFLPGIGPGELFVIFVLVLLIFGPKKLPEVGKALGEFVNQFKKASTDINNVDKDTIKEDN